MRGYTAAGDDAFVARLSAAGALTWNTFLGGAGSDYGTGIATDTAGNVYVTGYSGATWGVPVRVYTGGSDAFAARLSATGALTWNTFLGGAGADRGRGIATDTAGDVYVTGYSAATWGAPVRVYSAGDDAFAARLAGATGALTWHTFLGGAGTDRGYGIATDAAGNVYVTGYSSITWGTPVNPFDSIDEAFVARLSAAGALTWNTFLGGAGGDYGYGIATDAAGNVYVTGYSGATWGAPVRAFSGGADAFAARLDAASGVLGSSTFLGGAGDDIGYGIATDPAGNAYVTGYSTATWGTPVRAYTGGADAFVAQLAGVGGGGGGGIPGPYVCIIVNGQSCEENLDTTLLGMREAEARSHTPVKIEYKLHQSTGLELFAIMDAPALGVHWSYLDAAGKYVALPTDYSKITPWQPKGRDPDTYTLFNGILPAGVYELYMALDFTANGYLDYQYPGILNGRYAYARIRVH